MTRYGNLNQPTTLSSLPARLKHHSRLTSMAPSASLLEDKVTRMPTSKAIAITNKVLLNKNQIHSVANNTEKLDNAKSRTYKKKKKKNNNNNNNNRTTRGIHAQDPRHHP